VIPVLVIIGLVFGFRQYYKTPAGKGYKLIVLLLNFLFLEI